MPPITTPGYAEAEEPTPPAFDPYDREPTDEENDLLWSGIGIDYERGAGYPRGPRRRPANPESTDALDIPIG